METCEDRKGKLHEVDVGRSTSHAVVIPLPSQGHITPALQLAKKLVGLGFLITFVNTIHGERMVKSRSKAMEPNKVIEFVSVSDGLPDDFPRFRKFQQFSDAVLAMEPVFEELFINMLRESPITCVIRDIRFSAVHAVAKKLGIPVVGLATSSAISQQCVSNVRTLLSAGILPLPPSPAQSTPSLHHVTMILGPPRSEDEAAARQLAPLTSCIPGASPTLRLEDIPTHLLSHDLDHWFFRLIREIQSPLLPDCECTLQYVPRLGG